jgi:hypothetical protein
MREGTKIVGGHLKRMKHGNGIKDRDDKSNGIQILMSEGFVKINPNEPLMYTNQTARRKEIDPIPPVFRYPEPIFHGEDGGIKND